jgi:hypothetical protein
VTLPPSLARPEETTEGIVALYRQACADADEAITELDLDAVGKYWSGLTVSLRLMLLTLLMDTTRHATGSFCQVVNVCAVKRSPAKPAGRAAGAR